MLDDRSALGPIAPILAVLGVTVLAFVLSLGAGVAFLVPMLVLGYGVETTPVLLGATAAGQVGFLLAGYAYVRFRDVRVPLRVPSRSDALAVAGGTVVALAAAVALSAVLNALDLVPESVIGDVVTADPTFLLGLAVLSVLVVAPAEELLFRGAVQGTLRERYGPVPAVAGASLLFGSMHLTNYTGALLPVIAGASLIAAVGAVFGALYEWTDNLAVPVAAHATYNTVLLTLSYLTV